MRLRSATSSALGRWLRRGRHRRARGTWSNNRAPNASAALIAAHSPHRSAHPLACQVPWNATVVKTSCNAQRATQPTAIHAGRMRRMAQLPRFHGCARRMSVLLPCIGMDCDRARKAL